METYTLLREFADSWFLLGMVSFFIGVCIFAFWPSLQGARQSAALIPLRDEIRACKGTCANCPGAARIEKGERHG